MSTECDSRTGVRLKASPAESATCRWTYLARARSRRRCPIFNEPGPGQVPSSGENYRAQLGLQCLEGESIARTSN